MLNPTFKIAFFLHYTATLLLRCNSKRRTFIATFALLSRPHNLSHLKSISSTFYSCIFWYKFLAKKISSPKHSFVIFGTQILYKKCEHNMLMKLTPFFSHFIALFSFRLLCRQINKIVPFLTQCPFELELHRKW